MATDPKLSRKRKLDAAFSSRKKAKSTSKSLSSSKKLHPKKSSATRAATADQLPWKTVLRQDIGELGDNGEGGMMELEEVEGVEIIYDEDGSGGKIVGFRVKEGDTKDTKSDSKVTSSKNTSQKETEVSPIPIEPFDAESLPSWKPFPLHPALLYSLKKRGFTQPTPIQQQTLDIYLHGSNSGEGKEANNKDKEEAARRDIVGIAQTGSGKTLAYGLPILHHILSQLSTPSSSDPNASLTVTPPSSGSRRPLQALILAPTRELALQVAEHLNATLETVFPVKRKDTGSEKGKGKAKEDEEAEEADDGEDVHTKVNSPPPVSVAAIVGGMSAQKQRRILSRGADILVATPGRFWDLCGEDHVLTSQIRKLRFLVLDEADRMIEAGHFEELDNILRLTARPPESAYTSNAAVDGEQDPVAPEDLPVIQDEITSNEELQTFIFSATMSKDLQKDLKRGQRKKGWKKKGAERDTLDDLIRRLDFRDTHPVIIDLSPKGGRVKGLQESKVECLMNDKDYYLYYFLLRHPGRSLVFLSSIDGIRRLLPIMELLNINAWPLHSGLQQKQRLKNFDRFKSKSHSVLLATDIAARGLDVPSVDHVIHYQVPRSADAYVHRNGRTARANKEGFGLVLCAPDETRIFKGVLNSLGRDEDDVPELAVDHDILDKLKQRVKLARKIDSIAHRTKKENHDKNWMRETAEAMEIELDSDFASDSSETAQKSVKDKKAQGQIVKLKAELKDVLAQPLVARGVSMKYITSGTRSRGVIEKLIEGEGHEQFLGLSKVKAGSDVVRKKQKSGKK
ncbi:hypothetical protein M422DRAFT_213415 [Sphaerobolus stellatus SS14]|uniref:RNA helicase n=1 Tax=Sphaerobolus stellatus (strain SS14) TaxID=990650 RepID=A0A0C9V8A8_SPHS4|nr:hypothetical protein M422DRAFT_213415 [Sphaerobolus stellatus SS14]